MRKPRLHLLLILAAVLCCFAACGRARHALTLVVDGAGETQQTSVAPRDSVVAAPTVTIAMTGDVMLGTMYPEPKLPANGGRNLFDDAAPLLKGADVAVGNLEGVIADSMTPKKKGEKQIKAYYFRMPPSMAHLLSEAGYDFLSLANNHAYDFLAPGEASTRRYLDRLGISYAGTVNCESAVKRIGNVTYGFAAFGHNAFVQPMRDTAAVRRIITGLKAQCDVVIVSFHGGAEGVDHRHLPEGSEHYAGENRGNLRSFAHFAVDCGASVVYGHGPHVVRAIELYNGHLIAYSLGNFCTPCGVSVAGLCGYAPLLIASVDVTDGHFTGGRIHSMIQQWGIGPRNDSTNRVAREMAQLTAADIPVQGRPAIAPDGTITAR